MFFLIELLFLVYFCVCKVRGKLDLSCHHVCLRGWTQLGGSAAAPLTHSAFPFTQHPEGHAGTASTLLTELLIQSPQGVYLHLSALPSCLQRRG